MVAWLQLPKLHESSAATVAVSPRSIRPSPPSRSAWRQQWRMTRDLLLCHVSAMVAKLPTEFVSFKILLRGIPSHGGGGMGCEKKTGKDVDWRKEEKQVEILEWIPDAGISFINSSGSGKQSLDSTPLKNTGVSMPETACMFYPHHRSRKISIMSQLLNKNYNYRRPQTNFIIMFQCSSQVPSKNVWFHT